MDKFFVVLGKMVLALVVVAFLAGGGYWLGKSGKVNFGAPLPQPEAVTTTNPEVTETPISTQIPSVTPTVKAKTVTAGLAADSGLSFTKYQITVPEDWTPNHQTTNEGTWVDTLVISKGPYQIKIFQAATGGAICLYPGDTPMEGPSSTYSTFVEIMTQDGNLMRRSSTSAGSGTTKGFTVCMKSATYGNFQQPTIYGHTSYTTPLTPESIILKEMDEMVRSIKKII